MAKEVWKWIEIILMSVLLTVVWLHAYWAVSLFLTALLADSYIKQFQLNELLKCVQAIRDVLTQRLS